RSLSNQPPNLAAPVNAAWAVATVPTSDTTRTAETIRSCTRRREICRAVAIVYGGGWPCTHPARQTQTAAAQAAIIPASARFCGNAVHTRANTESLPNKESGDHWLRSTTPTVGTTITQSPT